jgi:hypothetical protein
MCEFHDGAATSLATDPTTQNKNPVLEHLAGVALNRHRIGTVFPQMKKLTGSDDYQLATRKAQSLFNAHPDLLHTQATLNFERDRTQHLLRDVLQDAVSKSGLSLADIETDKRKNKHYQSEAVSAVYDTTQAPFILHDQPTDERFQKLHKALQIVHNTPQADMLLKQRFEQAISSKFLKAPSKVNPNWLRLYERVPEIVRNYKDCAEGMCSASAGNLIGHLGCIFKMAVLPSLGASSSLLANPNVTFAVMGGGSAAGIGAWHYLHKRRGTKPSSLEKYLTYGSSILGLTGIMAYHTFGHSHHDHTAGHYNPAPIQKTADGREFMIVTKDLCAPGRALGDTIWNDTAKKLASNPQNQPQ